MDAKEKLKNFLFINLGLLLMAAGTYFFKIPNGFSTGGVSGLGTVFGGFISWLTPATIIFILNVALLIVGYLFLGRETGIITAYCSVAFSVETWLFERFIPLSHPLTDQPFLELVYAILLSGVGSAILFNYGASSGGTDIAALILKKYTSLNVGTALLAVDFLIAALSFWTFGIKAGLYSLLGLFAKAFLVDGVIESINSCKYFTIITEKPQEIIQYIMCNMHHGVTQYKAEGSFTHREKAVLLTLCRRVEGARLKSYIKQIDPSAFVIVTTTSEIIGRGFRGI